jgi:hypothetical protein
MLRLVVFELSLCVTTRISLQLISYYLSIRNPYKALLHLLAFRDDFSCICVLLSSNSIFQYNFPSLIARYCYYCYYYYHYYLEQLILHISRKRRRRFDALFLTKVCCGSKSCPSVLEIVFLCVPA